MNIFKKVSAAALAAVMTTSCLTAVASAKEEQMKLLTSPISVKQANEASGELAATESGFISIDVDSWQKTGEFSYSKLTADFNLPDNYTITTSKNGDYGYFIEPGDPLNKLTVFKIDKNNKTLKTVQDYGENWRWAISDVCYVISTAADNDAKTLSITVTSPEGKTNTHNLSYTGEGNMFYNTAGSYSSDEYVAFLLWTTAQEGGIGGMTAYYSFDIYGVKKDGNLETLYSAPLSEHINGYGNLRAGVNSISWWEYNTKGANIINSYSLSDGKITKYEASLGEYGYDYICAYDGGTKGASYLLASFEGVFEYGDKVIGKFPIDCTTSTYEYCYILLDKATKTGLTQAYKSMSTEDGKIFLVQTTDDKWGYIDANGKELAIFDDASSFVGDYAPVVKDGKAYLIDKNMNCVSENIDADAVTSISNNSKMFQFTKDGKTYLATFAVEDSKPTSEPTSEPTSSEPTSEPTSSETSGTGTTAGNENGNPDTGVAGIGFIVGAAALGGTAVVLSRKKK